MSDNEEGKELSRTIFDCLSPRCGTVLAAVMSDILANGLDVDQISVLSTFITMIGDNLGYIAAQMDLNKDLASRQNKEGAGTAEPEPPAP